MHCRRFGLSVPIAVAFVVSGLVGAAAQDAEGDAFADLTGTPEIQLTLTDSGLAGAPAETPAGWTIFTFTNSVTPTGDPFEDAWSLDIIQLPEGVTAADLSAQLAAAAEGEGEGAPPGADADAEMASPEAGGENPFAIYYEAYVAGGPGALQGQTNQALVYLEPGDYAILVIGLDASAALAVTGEAAAQAPAVTADVVITYTGTSGSFDFAVETGGFAGGPAVLEIVNESDQPHFVFGLRSPEPITEEQAMALLMAEESATPAPGELDPSQIAPGVTTGSQSSGTTQYLTLDLEPGYYVLLCFVGDPAMGGVPHSFAGMVEIVQIGA